MTLTIVTAPVYVDAASVVAGKLGEGETRGVGCGRNESLELNLHETACSYRPNVTEELQVDQPQEAGSSDRSPQSSSRSHVQEMGMQRPLAHEY